MRSLGIQSAIRGKAVKTTLGSPSLASNLRSAVSGTATTMPSRRPGGTGWPRRHQPTRPHNATLCPKNRVRYTQTNQPPAKPGQFSGDCWNEDPTGDAMAVDWKSVWPLADDPDPDDPALTCETANAMRESDRRYSVLLRTINGGFLGEPELLKTAVVGMFSLKYRGMALMRTPRGDGRNAAPAWRWLDKGD